jgi:pantothenate kinase
MLEQRLGVGARGFADTQKSDVRVAGLGDGGGKTQGLLRLCGAIMTHEHFHEALRLEVHLR